jgi:hypothetical protein
LTLNASFPAGPKTVPATTPITCVTSANPCMTCPTALTTGAFPTALATSTVVLAKKLAPALLQEQNPLMQEVEERTLGSVDLGHTGHWLRVVHGFGLDAGL